MVEKGYTYKTASEKCKTRQPVKSPGHNAVQRAGNQRDKADKCGKDAETTGEGAVACCCGHRVDDLAFGESHRETENDDREEELSELAYAKVRNMPVKSCLPERREGSQ